MSELEAILVSLGADLEFPPTPDLAAAVGARLRPRRHGWRRLALAAALLFAAVGVALAGWAPSRDTIAGWLGVRGVGVERVQRLPPVPSPSGGSFGTETTLSGARTEVKFGIREAGGLGDPRVFVAHRPAGDEVTLVYRAGPDEVVLTELRGTLQQYSFQKLIGPGTVLEPVKVNGQDGWWLSGEPHEFFYDDSAGQPQIETLRLATNTLAWEEGGIIFRFEGPSLTKDQALTIAASLR